MQFLGKAIKEHGMNVKRLKLFFIGRSKEKKNLHTNHFSSLPPQLHKLQPRLSHNIPHPNLHLSLQTEN